VPGGGSQAHDNTKASKSHGVGHGLTSLAPWAMFDAQRTLGCGTRWRSSGWIAGDGEKVGFGCAQAGNIDAKNLAPRPGAAGLSQIVGRFTSVFRGMFPVGSD
jgi:hypothetical protein